MTEQLLETPEGLIIEYIDREEAEFLYEEIFSRATYLQNGVSIKPGKWPSACSADSGCLR